MLELVVGGNIRHNIFFHQFNLIQGKKCHVEYYNYISTQQSTQLVELFMVKA